jgi:hypothetical protein
MIVIIEHYFEEKEDLMENKRFFLGMLSMVLTFGLTVVGCGGGNDPVIIDPIEPSKSSAADIVSFKVGEIAGTISGTEIQVRLPLSSSFNIEAVSTVITLSDKAAVSPNSGASVDFSKSVEYTVTAEDGTTVKKYTVSIIQIAKVTDGNLKAVLDQITKGGSYDIEMASNNAGFAPYSISAGTSAKPKNIALYGSSGARMISLTSNQKGSLFTVGQYVTVTLKDITLQGISDNDTALVRVDQNGNLVLESGAKIIANTNTTVDSIDTTAAGGVSSSGTVTISGGEISGNTSHSIGGGIAGGTITLTSGKIANNNAKNYGGGVYGNITVNGGEISGNSAVHGGGVRGNVTMVGGSIKNNKAEGSGSVFSPAGGGVYGKVTMSGGTIEGNSAVSTASNPLLSPSKGGGIYSGILVLGGQESILSGGTITNNTASIGGGIYVPSEGSLTMSKDIVITPYNSTDEVSTNAIALTLYKNRTTSTVTNATINVAEAFSGSGIIANVDIFRDGAVDWPDVYGRTIMTGNIDTGTISRFVLVKNQTLLSSNTDLYTGDAEGNFILASDGRLARP